MLRVIISSVLVLTVLSSALAQEPEATEKPAPPSVEKLTSEALAAYKAGRNAEAVEKLQQAISLIQKEMGEDMASFIPDAPQGWKADDVRSSSGSLGGDGGQGQQWVRLSRAYTRTSDDLKVRLTISNSPQLVGTQRAATAMFSNPQYVAMLQSNPDMTIEAIDRDGWNGWMVVDKSNAQLMAFCGSTMITVEAPKADKSAIETIFGAVDLKNLAKIAGEDEKQPSEPQDAEQQ